MWSSFLRTLYHNWVDDRSLLFVGPHRLWLSHDWLDGSCAPVHSPYTLEIVFCFTFLLLIYHEGWQIGCCRNAEKKGFHIYLHMINFRLWGCVHHFQSAFPHPQLIHLPAIHFCIITVVISSCYDMIPIYHCSVPQNLAALLAIL